MATQTIDLLVKGGSATAGPPLGPQLGPTGMNVGEVVAAINQKTEAMKGMDVPVKVVIDDNLKTFEISVGTPPTSALIKKELNIEKGSGKAGTEMVADLPIDNIIKIAQVKIDGLLANEMPAAVKEVIGTCQSAGIRVEGMMPRDAIVAVNDGKWHDKITGKVALEEHSAEELAEKQKELQAEIEAQRAEAEAEAAEAPAEEAPAEGEEKPAEDEEKPAEEKKEAPAEEKKAE